MFPEGEFLSDVGWVDGYFVELFAFFGGYFDVAEFLGGYEGIWDSGHCRGYSERLRGCLGFIVGVVCPEEAGLAAVKEHVVGAVVIEPPVPKGFAGLEVCLKQWLSGSSFFIAEPFPVLDDSGLPVGGESGPAFEFAQLLLLAG